MTSLSYAIRIMTRNEIDIAIDWAAAEGWNPGIDDADCFYAADAGGFLIGLLRGEAIACISAVRYGATFGFIGFYIVKPEFRGRGYGMQIWNSALERLRGRNIGLDGVVDQQNNYRKSGFKLAYRNIRYEGKGGGRDPGNRKIVPLSSVPFTELNAYDRRFFPEDRTQFLRCWLNQPQSTAWGFMEKDRLAGYGVLRLCRSGYKIGPLFANDAAVAALLFQSLKSRTNEGSPIYLDIPEVNRSAVALAESNGMNFVFETARMYGGESPDLPLDGIFGVTTFELG